MSGSGLKRHEVNQDYAALAFGTLTFDSTGLLVQAARLYASLVLRETVCSGVGHRCRLSREEGCQ